MVEEEDEVEVMLKVDGGDITGSWRWRVEQEVMMKVMLVGS